jgi:hypothetical protein
VTDITQLPFAAVLRQRLKPPSQRCAGLIADAVERRDNLASHAAGLAKHRVDIIHGEVAEETFFKRSVVPYLSAKPMSARGAW